VPEQYIDESAFRIARTVLKFETAPDPVSEYPRSLIGCNEHISLAMEAAEKSMVLMQNNGSVLPLDKTKIKTVLEVGVLGDKTRAAFYAGYGLNLTQNYNVPGEIINELKVPSNQGN